MTVRDLLDLFIDGDFQKIQLYDIDTSEIIFKGTGRNLPEGYEYYEIQSIDNIGTNFGKDVVLNIITEE